MAIKKVKETLTKYVYIGVNDEIHVSEKGIRKILNDYSNWLDIMGRLKYLAHLPPFESPEKIVDYYLKPRKIKRSEKV
jgi:hypothetical protein